MPKRAHVRTQDERRIAIARSRSKRMFDLRDLRLVGGKEAWWAITRYLPPGCSLTYLVWQTKVMPLLERAGHAMLISRKVRNNDPIAEVLEWTSSRHSTWIVQVDALPMWAMYITIRQRKINAGEWKKGRPWSLDDFILLAYKSTAEDWAGVLVPNVGKGE